VIAVRVFIALKMNVAWLTLHHHHHHVNAIMINAVMGVRMMLIAVVNPSLPPRHPALNWGSFVIHLGVVMVYPVKMEFVLKYCPPSTSTPTSTPTSTSILPQRPRG
jgi:hypothetical protein